MAIKVQVDLAAILESSFHGAHRTAKLAEKSANAAKRSALKDTSKLKDAASAALIATEAYAILVHMVGELMAPAGDDEGEIEHDCDGFESCEICDPPKPN